jgi:hypothetical protein
VKTYTVRTGGDYEMTVTAASPLDAAVLAFKERAPESAGLITEVQAAGEEECYVKTERALIDAGYEFGEASDVR